MSFCGRIAATGLSLALLAPMTPVFAQATQGVPPANAGIARDEATLDERLEDPSLKILPRYEDEVEIWEDEQRQRYVRAEDFDRMAAEAGEQVRPGAYQVYVDQAGQRFYRLDAQDRPTTAAAQDERQFQEALGK